MMKRTRLYWLLVVTIGLVAGAHSIAAASAWDQPAATLAQQIADILGPGEVRLTFQNLSTIAPAEVPAIRKRLEQDLKSHGVIVSGADSASALRVTLSESASARLWVAEIAEGNHTQVTMVDLGPATPAHEPAARGMMLRSEAVITVNEPVLAAVEVAGRMVVLEPEEIVLYAPAADGWKQIQRVAARPSGALARDPRGVIVPAADGQGFAAWLSGTKCVGSASAGDANGEWEIECRPSDDPWPVAQPLDASAAGATPLRAFYNGTRDYFNGVVTPAIGIEPPAFYTAAAVPRPAGDAGLLIGGIDGLVQLAENGMLHSIAGTRDWGSDFAVLRSGCGAGTQMIAAGSGEALRDSLRAYELPALEAVPASAPLALNGTVTALWSAPDGKRAYAVVRNQANQYEVDRVTALCN